MVILVKDLLIIHKDFQENNSIKHSSTLWIIVVRCCWMCLADKNSEMKDKYPSRAAKYEEIIVL